MSVVGRRGVATLGMAIALGCGPALAQDLTAGRTPAQLFAGGCAVCHKSPQGLAKGGAGQVASFLRQHYTSKPEMADALAAYLLGAGNAREPAQGRAGRPGAPAAGPGGPAAQDPTAAAPGRARPTIAVTPGAEPSVDRRNAGPKPVPPRPVPVDSAATPPTPVPAGPKPQPAASRETGKPADGAEAAAPARAGTPSIITEERGRAAGQSNAARTNGSRKLRDAAGVGPDASGRADRDRVTNLHGGSAPADPPPKPALSEPPKPADADASPANAAVPAGPGAPAPEGPTVAATPPAAAEAAAPADTPPNTPPRPSGSGDLVRKPNVDKSAAVEEEKSGVRASPPPAVRPRAAPARGAAAGGAATARRPSPDAPN